MELLSLGKSVRLRLQHALVRRGGVTGRSTVRRRAPVESYLRDSAGRSTLADRRP